jgi:hypothetical protein
LRFQQGTKFVMVHRGSFHMTFAILRDASARVA